MKKSYQSLVAAATSLLLLAQACAEMTPAPATPQSVSLSKVKVGALTELAPPGVLQSYGTGVNGKGQVVGYYFDFNFSPYGYHGFLWDNGVFTDLGELAPVAINDQGQIVGTVRYEGRLWDHGVLTPLPGTPHDINSKGHVVGTYFSPAFMHHAYLWRDGVTTDLGSLDPNTSFFQDYSEALALNDNDQVVGYSGSGFFFINQKAFLWDGGVIQALVTDAPDNTYSSFATAINEQGQIVGFALSGAFLWENGTKTTIGSSSGFNSANTIDTKGVVGGNCYEVVGGRSLSPPCLWLAGTTTELESLGNLAYMPLTHLSANGKYAVGTSYHFNVGDVKVALWTR